MGRCPPTFSTYFLSSSADEDGEAGVEETMIDRADFGAAALVPVVSDFVNQSKSATFGGNVVIGVIVSANLQTDSSQAGKSAWRIVQIRPRSMLA